MTRVKICGITSPEEALAVAALGADFLGLIFYPGSPRCLTVERAKAIAQALGNGPLPQGFEGPLPRLEAPAPWFEGWARALEGLLEVRHPLLVGVFVNMAAAEVNAIAEACGLDLVQLSGDEDWDYCREIARPVIKALRVGEGASAREVLGAIPGGAASLLLLDSHRPGFYGGTGLPGNWQVAREVAWHFPIMLAGGLNPQNVGQAVREVRPWAVDVASGVETAGRKDLGKVAAFIQAVRGVGDEGDVSAT